MSVPIRSGASLDTGTSPGNAFAGARPQVQSRRVSLKLGPLGLTYATDQVLWPDADAAGQAPDAAALQAAGQTAGQTAGLVADQPAQQAASQNAQAPHNFSQELYAAWRQQVQERAKGTETYGPGAETSQSRQTSGQDKSQGANQARAPAPAMRRAIAAYLSCAAGFVQDSMIRAVA